MSCLRAENWLRVNSWNVNYENLEEGTLLSIDVGEVEPVRVPL